MPLSAFDDGTLLLLLLLLPACPHITRAQDAL